MYIKIWTAQYTNRTY